MLVWERMERTRDKADETLESEVMSSGIRKSEVGWLFWRDWRSGDEDGLRAVAMMRLSLSLSCPRRQVLSYWSSSKGERTDEMLHHSKTDTPIGTRDQPRRHCRFEAL